MAVVTSYDISNQSGLGTLDNTFKRWGQTATSAGQYKINSVGVQLSKFGTPTGTIYLRIYGVDTAGTLADTSNLLGSTSMDVTTIAYTSIPPTTPFTTFTFTNDVPVIATGKFAIVVEYADGTASNHVKIGVDVTQAYAGGEGFYSTSTTGSLTSYSSADIVFTVDGTSVSIPTQSQWTHNFNTGSLSPFTLGGDSPWVIDGTGNTAGTVVAKAGTITHSQTSSMTLGFTATDSVSSVKIRRNVSSLANDDYLKIYHNSVLRTSFSGTGGGWVYSTFTFYGAGTHEVTFTYEKNASGSSGSDSAWIDDVEIFSTNPVTVTSGTPEIEVEEETAPDPYPRVIKPVQHRELYFKIEKLDSDEVVLEEKSITITGGNIDVGSGGSRRKCTFQLVEPLPIDWQMRRWKLYYGYKNLPTDEITYVPQGVFIPINPSEREELNGYITVFQGVDKKKLFSDYQLDEPVTFASGTTVRSIIQTVAGWFDETKLNLAQDLGTLGAPFSFEEGSTAEQLLNTLITSFSAEWFYDPNGYLVARKRVPAVDRAVKYVLDDEDNPLYLSSERSIEDGNYYNKVTLVGGKVDTAIYRATLSDTDAITKAGGRVVQRYFTHDAAISQAQVDGLASYYLSNGVLLPSTLKLNSLVIPDLEVDDILSKDGVRYEARSFNIPLGLGSQTITAGEIL